MIETATQLKAKVRNLSSGDSKKAQTLIRNFIMERFLERVALSRYRNNFILKGGMLVAAVVGLDTRATMDIDTTVKSLELSQRIMVLTLSGIMVNSSYVLPHVSAPANPSSAPVSELILNTVIPNSAPCTSFFLRP